MSRHITGQPPKAEPGAGKQWLVSQFTAGRWYDRLCTSKLGTARDLLQQFGDKGRMLEFPGAVEVR